MNESHTPAPEAALDELLDVSPHVAAAVLLTRDGAASLAVRPAGADAVGAALAAACRDAMGAAEQARTELGREAVTQCEVATEHGHFFVVGDATHLIGAVTSADPTVGLVFYDLKTALRTVREAASAPPSPATAASNGAGDATAVGADGAPDGSTRSKWRRKS